MSNKPTAIYYGLRENMIAEVAAYNWLDSGLELTAKQVRYAIKPLGRVEYDTEYAASRKEALQIARELAIAWGSEEQPLPICFV